MPVIYSAVERFDFACDETWQKFIDWSGLTQLREIVSLDGILCPTIFRELTAKDWQHNVQEDFKTTFFYDLDHVLAKVAGSDRVSVLAVIHEPTPDELVAFNDPRFVFRGFDLIEGGGSISALVNCSGLAKAFSPADLSDCGLLTNHAKALHVQKSLQAEYPDEPHADCDVWAVWQMRSSPTLAVANRPSPSPVNLDDAEIIAITIKNGSPMPFNETLAQRIRDALARKKNIEKKKMFGGIGFLLNGNLLVGVWKNSLIVRLGPEEGENALLEPHVKEFDITGKAMKNWVLVESEGVGSDEDLKNWIQRAVKFVGKLPAK